MELNLDTITKSIAAVTASLALAGGGPNQIRLFSRSAGTEVQTGDIGFVKAYDAVLTLAEVQTLYGQYKARFGY